MDKNKFKFYLPAEILKSTNPTTGAVEMKFKGIASDSAKDAQGEYLDPSGFDLSGFRWINYNHLGKSDPATIIGEPTVARVTPGNELYIEGLLYPELPMAQSTFALMKALVNSPSGNKLSLSVEGKVLERDPKNSKRITKSKITAVAICPVPVNGSTWVDLLQKGFTGDEKDEEEYDEDTKKAIMAEGNVTTKEDVEHNIKDLTKKSLRKSDIYDKIFNQYPSIGIEEAKSVYSLIEKLSTMSKDAKKVSTETISKAFDILGLASEEISKASKVKKGTDENSEDEEDEKEAAKKNAEEVVKKGIKKADEEEKKDKKDEDTEKGEKDEDEDDDKEMTEKAVKMAKGYKKAGINKAGMKNNLMKKGYGEKVIAKAIEKADKDEDDGGEITKEVKKSIDDITDLIKSQNESFNAKFKAIGEIMKNQSEENADLKKSLDTTLEANASLKKDIEKALSQPAGFRKSVKSFSEKFEKSADGKHQYNINSAADRKALQTKILDLSGINKGEGFDQSLAKIAQDIELTKSLTPQSLQRLEGLDIKVMIG